MSEVKVKRTRASVTTQEFIRVTVAQRDKYPTAELAAKELGMTLNSFKQRLGRSKKQWPKVYADVPRYGGPSGPHVATEEEALQILQSLLEPGEVELKEETAPQEGDEATA